MASPTLLVTGASGHLGQRVLHHLIDTLGVPASRVIATTRRPGQLADWAARGVSVRALDFADTAAIPAALAGATRLLLISTDAIGQRLAQHEAVITAARAAGIEHVVYTSMPDPSNSLVTFAPEHAGTEDAIASSGIPDWTILRNHWYFENLLMSLPSVLASGTWFTAAGDGGFAHIARNDLARAAAVALVGSTQPRTTYELTGARAWSVAEIAALVSAATGRAIDVVPVTVDALAQGMIGHGVPEPLARALASSDANAAAGNFSIVTDHYRVLTGVEPQPFEQWLAEPATLAALAGKE